MDRANFRLALMTIQNEYLEMPDLRLTLTQAARLWNLPMDVCRAAVGTLTATGFLVESNGAFLRRGTPPVHIEHVDPSTWAVGRISQFASFPH